MPAHSRRPLILLVALAISLALGIAPSALAQGSADVSALRKAFAGAMNAKDWTRAVDIGARLAPIDPQGGAVAYNIACAWAHKGDPEQAADWLVKAGEAGFQGASIVRTDTDLDTVRSQPQYAKAVSLIDANRAKVFEAFTAEHSNHRPRTILPPNHDPAKPATLIIALHGSGGTPDEMERLWRNVAARHGAILCVPGGMRPLGNGYQWMFMDESEWLILHALEYCKKEHSVDPQRVVLAGFSQGGNMSFYLAMRHPELFCGIIPVAAHWEPNVEPLPDPPAPAMPRFAMLIGARDEGTASNRQLDALLRKSKVPVRLKIYPGLGHAIPPNYERELDQALQFVLLQQ